ncbi:HEAT repeat domain-containing protein [Plantactinospora endophytica]|uniref:HEAT repeat domain-containing protein n=1 Tax=Plantactinospora endophytica TaxID=673535 RepID=A0ABQ4E087_9ACTN|nr:HEAT repeat domain-containing protein [Plantactinospora endophytica]GIG88083.1 hypothetical protein Pen02_30190 [Plantactinospora endophytica]
MYAVLAATRTLLTSLDPLPYRKRRNRLVAWASTAPDRVQVCADLREQGPYERHLALVVALATQDTDGIAAATRDPQPSIRGAALTAALRAGIPIGDVTERPAVERRRIYRALRRTRASAVADVLVTEVRARFGDEEAAALLPACGADTVRDLLPDLEHAVDLERLVRWHSVPLLDRVRERLAAAPPELRGRIWGAAAGAVLRCDPGQALDLLERFAPEESLPGALDAYGVLAAHDAGRVARLLGTPGRAAWRKRVALPPAVLRRLAALPTDELAPLASRFRDHGRALAALLDAVPPARRGELYDRALAEVDTAVLVPDAAIMEVLPAAVRIREATRVLGLARIREREAEVRVWSAYLAWPDASSALDVAVRSGDADERAHGYTLLVEAARRSRDPQAVGEVVVRLGRLRNEQDPVRAAALTALAKVAALLTVDTAAGLTRLTTDAVDARDASAATTTALSTLAADVLRHHVAVPELRDWALLTIDLVSTGANVPVLRRFDSVLRRGQETMVFERLRGWVEAGMARGRYGPLFALTHALGRRAWRLPGLQDLLRRAIGPHTLPSVARTAIGLWLDDPRSRPERVAEVIETEPTAVALHGVWVAVCSSRTDLLDLVLDRRPRGRFVESGTRWVPDWAPHVERWLPRQQARFVELQELVVADTGQGVWRRVAAIRAAAGVPGAGRELVLRHLDAPEVAITEAALGALVWTDRPDEALPVLLRYADGDRARVALYAAGRAARHVPPSRLADVLGELLTAPAKITSRKEAARLLARYGPPRVMATLLDAYTDPDAHRDVRAAIVSAARQRLDTEASWTILRTAVDGSREERRAVLGAYPYTIPERHRPRYGALLVRACRATDREVRRAAFGQLGEWAPWLAGITELVVDRLCDLGETMAHIEVANLLRAGGDAVLGTALAGLVQRDADDDRPGDPAADRPARRRVELLARGAVVRSTSRPAGADRTGLVESARWLAGRPAFVGTAVGLLVDLGRLDNLDEVAGLCAGRPVLAVRAAERVGARLRGLREWPDPAVLADAVARLAGRGDLAGGLFAVALVRHGAGFGWPAPWRDLLVGLRRHPDADVREEAYAVDMS